MKSWRTLVLISLIGGLAGCGSERSNVDLQWGTPAKPTATPKTNPSNARAEKTSENQETEAVAPEPTYITVTWDYLDDVENEAQLLKNKIDILKRTRLNALGENQKKLFLPDFENRLWKIRTLLEDMDPGNTTAQTTDITLDQKAVLDTLPQLKIDLNGFIRKHERLRGRRTP